MMTPTRIYQAVEHIHKHQPLSVYALRDILTELVEAECEALRESMNESFGYELKEAMDRADY